MKLSAKDKHKKENIMSKIFINLEEMLTVYMYNLNKQEIFISELLKYANTIDYEIKKQNKHNVILKYGKEELKDMMHDRDSIFSVNPSSIYCKGINWKSDLEDKIYNIPQESYEILSSSLMTLQENRQK